MIILDLLKYIIIFSNKYFQSKDIDRLFEVYKQNMVTAECSKQLRVAKSNTTTSLVHTNHMESFYVGSGDMFVGVAYWDLYIY